MTYFRASQMSMESVSMGVASRKNSQMSDRRDSQLSALSGGSGNSRRSSSAYGMDFSVSEMLMTCSSRKEELVI